MDAKFYQSVKDQLFNNILPYWEKHSRDQNPQTKGFFGDIDNDNTPDLKIQRSIVMTSRFLWTYSAVARFSKDPKYLEMADFAYDVIINKYFDKENDGVYWSVMPDGSPKVSKKQIYGEAFCCYGLSEYAAAIRELRENSAPVNVTTNLPDDISFQEKSELLSEQAMNHALDIYNLLEKYAYDPEFGGYVEARDRDWSETDDMILSPKDMNCPKSMNTNLHVMEAYTNLYRTLPVVFADAKSIRAEVGDSLSELVRITVDKILQPNAHLGMFFDMQWNLLADEISYGHDIEASWLLWEAACELADDELKSEIRPTVIKVAQVALDEGFDPENGCLENFLRTATPGDKIANPGMPNASDGMKTATQDDKSASGDQSPAGAPATPKFRDRTRVWWNQAESMNGFYNAWEMTGDQKYAAACEKQWAWILNHQVDKIGGDWWSALDINGRPILTEAKGGNWKTSYHNGRTCLELLRRSKSQN